MVKPSKKQVAAGAVAYELGQARPVEDARALFESEYAQQYRSLPFWKRSVILVAGVAVNLLFAIVAFVVLYTVIGFDMQTQTGEIVHVNADPLRSIQVGFMYIGMVVQAVAGLFNPATAADTVSNSASIVGIAVMSKDAAALGFESFLQFTAMISVSLGIMNLLPIPPLDGGRFVIEVFQKISRKVVTMRALNYLSAAGMILFIGFSCSWRTRISSASSRVRVSAVRARCPRQRAQRSRTVRRCGRRASPDLRALPSSKSLEKHHVHELCALRNRTA
ncbi:MAG: site-2 protease family protein [Eggerthellaceae bacterium]